jgi:hypothetical protein
MRLAKPLTIKYVASSATDDEHILITYNHWKGTRSRSIPVYPIISELIKRIEEAMNDLLNEDFDEDKGEII